MSIEAECIFNRADERTAIKAVDITVDAVSNTAQEDISHHGSDVTCREQIAERLYAVRKL